MAKTFTTTWKWTLACLTLAALASICLRNATAVQAPPPGPGLPDSGAQLQAVVDELKVTNAKLDALQKLLESGKLKVEATLDKDTK